MRARISGLGTPSKLFRAPVVPPGEMVMAQCAYDPRVAKAAYFLAQRRGFEPGCELEDWVTAEAQIANALGHPESK